MSYSLDPYLCQHRIARSVSFLFGWFFFVCFRYGLLVILRVLGFLDSHQKQHDVLSWNDSYLVLFLLPFLRLDLSLSKFYKNYTHNLFLRCTKKVFHLTDNVHVWMSYLIVDINFHQSFVSWNTKMRNSKPAIN